MLDIHLSLLASLGALALSSSAGASPRAGFALVVTNNRSLSESRPDLQYADDDGAKYAELFADELGPESVQLLSDFDPPSRLLYADWNARAVSATRQHLEEAVSKLARDVARAKKEGHEVHVYLVFAGHGDVDRGQGYLELADARLTARDLDESVLAKLPADRVHLILDSCNSYFMLNPRQPGGRRWETKPEVVGLLDRYPQLGAIISTSAEAVTYEWSELQSGIFSYELRSGLRGAADVNGDGNVSYVELAAFVEVANEAVANDLYRPKVFVHAPGNNRNESFLQGEVAARLLTVGASGARRVTLRDAQGVRILDLHKEDGTAVALRLPHGRVGVYEQAVGRDRPLVLFSDCDADAEGAQALETLAQAAPTLIPRGEAPVFSSLFQEPFGRRAFELAEVKASEPKPAYFGVTKQDVERLRLHLHNASELRGDVRRHGVFQLASGTAVATAAASAAVLITNSRLSNRDFWRAVAPPALIPGALGTLALGVYALFDDEYDDLLTTFDAQDMSTEESRARALFDTRAKFRDLADEARSVRIVGGAIIAGMGVALAGLGAYDLSRDHHSEIDAGPLALVIGGVYGLMGLLHATVNRTPTERAWALYEASESGTTADAVEGATGTARPDGSPQVQLTPGLGFANGFAFLGFSATF